MNAHQCIDRMDRFRHILTALRESISPEEAAFKPTNHDWSITEIISHMLDMEIEDMRTRLQLTLEQPKTSWPPIDPEGWAIDRNYKDNDFKHTIDQLIKERTASITWLRTHKDSDWSTTHTHPKFGSMSAGNLLAAWCSHDSLHLKQITKRLYQITQQDAAPWSSQYAGEWKA